MEGVSVQQTHAEATKKTASGLPRTHSGCTCTHNSGAMGNRSPTAGEKPRPDIFSGWFVARVNLVFYEPGLGQVTP